MFPVRWELDISQKKSGTVATAQNLKGRTTPTVTISWHYLTRSTSLNYLKKEKKFNPLYFGLSHTSVSSDRHLRNAGSGHRYYYLFTSYKP
jgi:hypothetical protein